MEALGSGDFVHWWNLDLKRPQQTVALDIDVGRRIHPTITPEDPDTIEAARHSSALTMNATDFAHTEGAMLQAHR
jgi:hypothetical protein